MGPKVMETGGILCFLWWDNVCCYQAKGMMFFGHWRIVCARMIGEALDFRGKGEVAEEIYDIV